MSCAIKHTIAVVCFCLGHANHNVNTLTTYQMCLITLMERQHVAARQPFQHNKVRVLYGNIVNHKIFVGRQDKVDRAGNHDHKTKKKASSPEMGVQHCYKRAREDPGGHASPANATWALIPRLSPWGFRTPGYSKSISTCMMMMRLCWDGKQQPKTCAGCTCLMYTTPNSVVVTRGSFSELKACENNIRWLGGTD